MLITLLKNSDRVKIACLAQLVNAIAPIMTDHEKGVWKQTIFYPFLHASTYGRGTAVNVNLSCPKFDCKARTDVDCLDSVAVYNEETKTTAVFVLNRSAEKDLETEVTIAGANELVEHILFAGHDIKAENSLGNELVCPKAVKNETGERLNGEKLTVIIPKLSWQVLVFRAE
jgi:alpha-N-arabinofuranosidase